MTKWMHMPVKMIFQLLEKILKPVVQSVEIVKEKPKTEAWGSTKTNGDKRDDR